MKKTFFIIFFGTILNYGCQQNQGITQPGKQTGQSKQTTRLVGEDCDGCELIYVGMPSTISATDTSPAWNEKGQRLLVQGTVYKQDRKTPASGIIVYYHQTDNNGLYSPSPTQDAKSKRHGHIRGWVKTGSNGNYTIYTIKPSPYPGRTLPAHIHITLKEPGINEYYIDDINFDDDSILTKDMRNRMENRGGPGIVQLTKNNTGLLVCKRNIILGRNIPDYK